MLTQTLKTWVRVIGAAVVFFAVLHFFLNLYIVFAHFTMEPDKLRSIVTALSKAFGLIVIPEDLGIAVFFVKVLASLLFLTVGAGLMALKEWSRKPMLTLLVLRALYGIFVCVYYKVLHMHLGLILFECIFLAYYLTRPAVRSVFGK